MRPILHQTPTFGFKVGLQGKFVNRHTTESEMQKRPRDADQSLDTLKDPWKKLIK